MKIVDFNLIPIAEEVPLDNLMELLNTCLKLQKICDENNGIGICAVQVGLPIKLFLLKVGSKYRYFVNCYYEAATDEKVPVSLEGCLSLPKRYFILENHRWSKVRILGKELVIKSNEVQILDVDEVHDKMFAIVIQHEIDHFIGEDGLICNLKCSKEIDLEKL